MNAKVTHEPGIVRVRVPPGSSGIIPLSEPVTMQTGEQLIVEYETAGDPIMLAWPASYLDIPSGVVITGVMTSSPDKVDTKGLIT